MMVGVMVCVALALSGCCTKKVSSDVYRSDIAHRERRVAVVDSQAVKCEAERMVASATEVLLVREVYDLSKADSAGNAPVQERTVARLKKSEETRETDDMYLQKGAAMVLEEQEDSTSQSDEHVTEESEPGWVWPWSQTIWVTLCIAVLCVAFRDTGRRWFTRN